ncbi:MAG TPA: hypothetical protein VHE10_01545 [Candidatus Paceibacterota bacterium]|nr:hypothetical protein [Candidatus Paceibacterota bacterium]
MPFTNIQVLGGASIPFSFAWKVPAELVSGTYKASTFLISSGELELAGAEQSDRETGASTLFTVTSSASRASFIDPSSIRVNEKPLDPNRMLSLSASRSATTTLSLISTDMTTHGASISWKVYRSNVIDDSQLVSSVDQDIRFVSGKAAASFAIPALADPLYHVLVEMKDGGKNSYYSYRIFNRDAPYATFISLSLGSFPLEKGKVVKVSGCAFTDHAIAEDRDYLVHLSLLKPDGSVFADIGTLSGISVSGFSGFLTPDADYSGDLILKGDILKASSTIENARVLYSLSRHGEAGSVPSTAALSFIVIVSATLVYALSVRISRTKAHIKKI